MTLTSVGYALFFALVAILYFALPRRFQNGVLLAASVVFYCFNLPGAELADGSARPLWLRLLPLAVLAFNVVFTFFVARAIGAAKDARRKQLLALGVCVSVVVLCFFKYCNFFLPTLFGFTAVSFPLPLGISFYTFAVISYLVDVYYKATEPETNFLNWALFVSFFATITSGPICRAQKVLPQLREPRRFDAQRTCDAFRLILAGLFKQIAVANVLGLFVNQVFENSADYSGLILPLAAALYVIQLYFEFSGYSDIARGCAMLLGIDIPVNFKTPLFSTNFSTLWKRWHISLSSWLQDYLFTPIVWSRWGDHLPRVTQKNGKKEAKPFVTTVGIVFFISGFWHGNTWPFVIWGLLQGLYRVGEDLLHSWYRKPPKRPSLPVRMGKIAVVFVLWAASHVFFRIGLVSGGTVGDCLHYFANSFTDLSSSHFVSSFVTAVENGFYTRPIMVVGWCVYMAAVLAIGVYADWRQCFKMKDAHWSTGLAKLPLAARWLCYYVLIGCILVGFIMQSGGFGTVSFAYANF